MPVVQQMLGKTCPRILARPFSSYLSVCPPLPQPPIVTLLDCDGCVPKNLALLLKQSPYIKELRLFHGSKDTKPIERELSYIDSLPRVEAFPPDELREAIEDLGVVLDRELSVIDEATCLSNETMNTLGFQGSLQTFEFNTCSLKRKKGANIVVTLGGSRPETPDEADGSLFEKNVDSVRNAALYLSEFNPKAIFCIAQLPLESLVPMVAEEYKRAQVYDPRKIIGVTAFASQAANCYIARNLNIPPSQVLCPVIGGYGPKTTVPVVSQAKPTVGFGGEVFNELLESIACADRSVMVEYECKKFKNPPLLSQAVALYNFINAVAKSFSGLCNCVECAFVPQTGHIGEFLPYMTSIVVLGRDGIQSTHMPKVNELEIARLREAMPIILDNIYVGQSFVNGSASMHKRARQQGQKKKCDPMVKQKLEECKVRQRGG